MILLYNNLTRKKQVFAPITPGKVDLYTCGPTVYDYQHIGNMRAYITWDILKRFLTQQGYEVKHIMNVTDVGHLTDDADAGEDKIEVARKIERSTAWQVAEKYFEAFKLGLTYINVVPAAKYVKATDEIKAMIDFVRKLEQKGYLYKISDGMYFDTSKDPSYGKLGKIDLKGMRPGARVEVNQEKRNPTDFAVWKFSPKDEQRDMEWDSPWGKGFPGWHLECSVIAMKYLGEKFDIHTGGIDHLTVHHPNEIAQSKAVTGEVPAQYWLHNNFINFQDKKMAKSAGTYVRLADIYAGNVDPLAYRYYAMSTHYRKEIAYSWSAIQAAYQGLKNLYKEISFFSKPKIGCADFEKKFIDALSDDLNTAKALDIMHRLIKSSYPSGAKLKSLFMMDEVLGLRMKEEWKRRRTLPPSAIEILRQREDARAHKEWDVSDALRDKLLDQGIEVMDTSEGQAAALSE